jgi:hypothetical protein
MENKIIIFTIIASFIIVVFISGCISSAKYDDPITRINGIELQNGDTIYCSDVLINSCGVSLHDCSKLKQSITPAGLGSNYYCMTNVKVLP